MTSHLDAVRNSAAWAAWGDSLGFITELADAGGVRWRAHTDHIDRPVPWRRKIGGRSGIEVQFAAGTYSDDTQLRLATSRAIRDDGSFDVDALACVELPVWQNYALGAGLGSKAAASNLSRHDSQWNQNVFKTKGVDYTQVGGNGAAMRIQPHVWAAADLNDIPLLVNRVVRDAICTHGSPVGILGAVIHALTLAWTFRFRTPPGPAALATVTRHLGIVAETFTTDEDLALVWIPAWERSSKTSFQDALAAGHAQALSQLDVVTSAMTGSPVTASTYRDTLANMGGLDPSTRGSGITTAWLAALATHLDTDPARALGTVANTLGSDTDTIATMAGAVLGTFATTPPPGPIQDAEYIEAEATRLAHVARNESATSYRYPDLLHWRLPRSPLDVVGVYNGTLALAGHGPLSDIGEPQQLTRGNNRSFYRWATTPHDQRVFIHHREEPQNLPRALLPPDPQRTTPDQTTNALDVRDSRQPQPEKASRRTREPIDLSRPGRPTTAAETSPTPPDVGLFPSDENTQQEQQSIPSPLIPALAGTPIATNESLTTHLETVKRANFDAATIGQLILAVIDTNGPYATERAIALATLIAQARHEDRPST